MSFGFWETIREGSLVGRIDVFLSFFGLADSCRKVSDGIRDWDFFGLSFLGDKELADLGL